MLAASTTPALAPPPASTLAASTTPAPAPPPASTPASTPLPSSTPTAPPPASTPSVQSGIVVAMETLPAFPDDAPKWLKDAVTNIAATPLGGSFKAVLEAVIRVEEAHSFDSDVKGTLPTTGRPDVLHDWVKGGRGSKTKKIPVIKKFSSYPAVWQGWWDSLQPAWRKRGVDGHWEIGGEYSEDWEALDCPGVNGVLNLAASLYFWGHQAEEARAKEGEEWFTENRKLWDDAVHDVT
ncbi:hypothetical protein B0H13DRAFT_1649441 [Mycena leptocephala]|nr:hypothetical protein B0H13DRAFT_1649441 [Mycena leptocephala]